MDMIYRIIDLAGMFICFICCAIVLMEKESKNQKYLLMTYICGLIITVGNLFEFVAVSPEAAMVGIKIAYLGKCFVMLFALLFATGFCRIRFSSSIIKVLAVLNIVIISLVMSCEKHRLFYTSIEHVVLEHNRIYMVLGKGPLFYVWMAEIVIGILGFGFMALYEISKKKNASRTTNIRMILIALSTVGPLVIAATFMFGDVFSVFDPSTVAITFTEMVLLLDVKKYGLLDTMQAAQERILQDSKDGILVVDAQKERILFANSIAKVLFSEMQNIEEGKIIDRIFKTDEKVIEKDGRHFETRVSPITNREEVLGYVAWIFDMTFIDKYASEMIKLKEASEQANIAKTNFLAHMSHEIRTPMNAIVGFSELAFRTENDKLIKEYLKNIQDSAHTLLHLINEILDISKIETGKMEITSVNYRVDDVIHELKSMIETQASKVDIDIYLDIDPEIPPYLVGDRVKVQEILINLMNNGLKYTREGSVSLKIVVIERDETSVKLHMEVRDTGIGIEEKNFPHVFGKFEKFDEKKNYGVEGTGLGLSIVKNFVEMMSGTISFESEYGKGTVFLIDLWQEIGSGPQIAKSETEDTSQKQEQKIKKGHLLVVDDNDLNCVVAQGILNCLGMETEISYSGKECLDRLLNGEKYDMIFMDHMMPEMDGVECLHRIRSLGDTYMRLPIVLLTANAVSGVRDEMLLEGFDSYLSKPIDIDELTAVLKKYLGVEEENEEGEMTELYHE